MARKRKKRAQPATAAQVDRGTPSTAEGSGQGGGKRRDVIGLISAGRAALEAYDYETAQRHLRAALQGSAGGEVPAQLLLELLVDHLGANQDALAVAPLLGTAAAANPEIRALIGLAAARTGDSDRAEELVREASGTRAGEVYLALADSALRLGHSERANERLQQARSRGVTGAEAARLEEAIGELRSGELAPIEEKLAQQHASGQLDASAAAARAREVLAGWPESTVARRILRQLEESRRSEQLAELIERAEAEVRSGALGLAVSLFREAISLDQERAGQLEPRIAELQRQQQRQEEENRIGQVVALLASDMSQGLLAYLALEPELRPRVRLAQPSPAEASPESLLASLAWLDEAAPPPTGARARAAVDAVLALGQASPLLASGDGAAVCDLLQPHQRALANVSHARQVLNQARAQIASAAQDQASRGLAEASEAFAAGDLGQARSQLDEINLGALPSDQRKNAEELAERIGFIEKTRLMAQQVDELSLAEDWLAARDLAGQLAALNQGQERSAWELRCQQLAAEIRQRWCVQVSEGSNAGEDLWRYRLARAGTPMTCLSADGALVLASVYAEWIFLWLIEVESGQARVAVRLRTPEPLGEHARVVLHGSTLWLVGESGELAWLSVDTWDLLGWLNLSTLLRPGDVIASVCLVPGSRFVWLRIKRDHQPRVVVVDLETRRVGKQLDDARALIPILGEKDTSGGPPVLVIDDQQRPVLYTSRGTPELGSLPAGDLVGVGTAIHPDGKGLALLLASGSMPGEDDELEVRAARLDGNLSEPFNCDGSFAGRTSTIASDLTAGLVFVRFDSIDRTEVVALKGCPSGFEQVWGVPASSRIVLAQDSGSTGVVAIVPDYQGVRVVALDEDLPDLLAVDDLKTGLPALKGPLFCQAGQETSTRSTALCSELGQLKQRRQEHEISQYLTQYGDDPDFLLDLVRAVKAIAGSPPWSELANWLADRFPSHSGVLMFRAHNAADDNDWEEVGRLLSDLPIKTIDESMVRHHQHLLGISLFLDDEIDAAKRVWKRGLHYGGECCLEEYIHLATSLPRRLRPKEWAPNKPLVRRLLTATAAADLRIEDGLPDQALEILDHEWVWRMGDIWSLGRIVAAWVDRQTDGPPRFGEALALASFCALLKQPLAYTADPVPGSDWEKSTLEELAQRARKRLQH